MSLGARCEMELPKEFIEKVYKVISTAKADGKIRRGANEATKSLERSEAKLVVYASDVSPAEITMHFEPLGKEKGIPVVTVPAKSELGAASGLPVGTAAIAVVNSGDRKSFEDLLKSLKLSSKPIKKSTEKSNEEKKSPTETPKEEKKLSEEPKEKVGETEKVEDEDSKPEEPKEEPSKVEEKAEPKKEPEEEEKSVDEKANPKEEPTN